MEEDGASLARTDSMSQSQRGPRHRRMESVETRSSMDLPPDALLQVHKPPSPTISLYHGLISRVLLRVRLLTLSTI